VAVFGLLAATLLTTIGSVHPPKEDFNAFLTDIRYGRAEAVSVPPTSGWLDANEWTNVRWRTGLATWHEATYTGYYSAEPSESATYPGGGMTLGGRYFAVQSGDPRDQIVALTEAVSTSFGQGQVPIATGRLNSIVAASYMDTAGLAIWLLMFLVMLGRDPDPVATRWGWTWLFTLGMVGPLVYTWIAPSHRDRYASRRPIRGGLGFLCSAVAAIVLYFAGRLIDQGGSGL